MSQRTFRGKRFTIFVLAIASILYGGNGVAFAQLSNFNLSSFSSNLSNLNANSGTGGTSDASVSCDKLKDSNPMEDMFSEDGGSGTDGGSLDNVGDTNDGSLDTSDGSEDSGGGDLSDPTSSPGTNTGKSSDLQGLLTKILGTVGTSITLANGSKTNVTLIANLTTMLSKLQSGGSTGSSDNSQMIASIQSLITQLNKANATTGGATGNTDSQKIQKIITIAQSLIGQLSGKGGSGSTGGAGGLSSTIKSLLGNLTGGGDGGDGNGGGSGGSGGGTGSDTTDSEAFSPDSGESTGDSTTNSVPIKSKPLETNTKKTATATERTTYKLTCENKIERETAQSTLMDITKKNLNWVNKGLQGGGSLYAKNEASMLQEIRDKTIAAFNKEITSDEKKFPFGKSTAQSIGLDHTISFADQMKYTLDDTLAENSYGTTEDFQNDFSMGGWGAFSELLKPQNDPIAFEGYSKNHLQGAIADTGYSRAQDLKDQLQRNGGFLDLKKCVATAPDSGDTGSTGDTSSGDGSNPQGADPTDTNCQRYETITPGSAVSSQLNEALATPYKQLEQGQDLSPKLTSTFNTMLTQLLQQGLSQLTTAMNANDSTQYTNNQTYASNISIDKTTSSTGSWAGAGSEYQLNIFDLSPTGIDASDPAGKRTNLLGLIYREKLLIPNDQNDPNSGADILAQKFGWSDAEKKGWITLAAKSDPNYRNILGRQINLTQRLISGAYQLDYCVPGPHQGWQSTSSQTLQAELRTWPKNVDDTAGVIGIVGTIGKLLGSTFGSIANFFVSATKDQRTEALYAAYVGGALSYHGGGMSGVSVGQDAFVNGNPSATRIMTTLFQRYTTAINNTFTKNNLTRGGLSPQVIADDATEYPRIPTYTSAIIGAGNRMDTVRASIDQLVRLGVRVQALRTNADNLDGYPKVAPKTYADFQTELTAISKASSTTALTPYQRELKRISDTFNLLAPDIIGASDLAKEEKTLDTISSRLETIAGKGGDIEQCIKDVNDPTYTGPVGRVAFPANLQAYLPESLTGAIKQTPSFLPDYSYGAAGSQTIQSNDIVNINSQPTSNALAGLEALVGTY